MDIADVNFDDRPLKGVEGIEDRDRGVRESRRIDDDSARGAAGYVDPVDYLIFAVALVKDELEVDLLGHRAAVALDVSQRRIAVYFRLPLPEQIEVRTVQHDDQAAHRLFLSDAGTSRKSQPGHRPARIIDASHYGRCHQSTRGIVRGLASLACAARRMPALGAPKPL